MSGTVQIPNLPTEVGFSSTDLLVISRGGVTYNVQVGFLLSSNLASPSPIGSTTPNTGSFSTLNSTYSLQTSGISGQFSSAIFSIILDVAQASSSNFYVGSQSIAQSAFPSALGFMIGSISQTTLQTGATGYQEVVSHQVELSTQTGSSVNYKFGSKIVLTNDDVASGSLQNSAYVVNAQQGWAGYGFDTVFCVGSLLGWWPVSPTGTILGTSAPAAGGPSYTAGWGVNFSAITFSSGAFQSTGFQVGPTGNTTVRELIFTNVLIDESTAVVASISGGSVVIASGVATQIVNPAGTLASLSIASPFNPSNSVNSSQKLRIIFTQAITSLAWAGWTTFGAALPTSVAAGACVTLEWVQGIGWIHILQA